MKPRSRFRGLTMFVTVGSTRFDELIECVLRMDTVNELVELGFTKLILQVGHSQWDQERLTQLRMEMVASKQEFEVELYEFKPSISGDIERADVIVGHAGAGTCLESLRHNKRLLIVVNKRLMDNHQRELADQLARDNLVVQTNVDQFNVNLALICNSELRLAKLPPREPAKFEQIFDEALRRVTAARL